MCNCTVLIPLTIFSFCVASDFSSTIFLYLAQLHFLCNYNIVFMYLLLVGHKKWLNLEMCLFTCALDTPSLNGHVICENGPGGIWSSHTHGVWIFNIRYNISINNSIQVETTIFCWVSCWFSAYILLSLDLFDKSLQRLLAGGTWRLHSKTKALFNVTFYLVGIFKIISFICT